MSFDIKDILSRISKLNQKEKLHILNILYTKNIEFTKNANGYFFNFLNIDDDVIEKIYNCLILIEENTDTIKEMERRRNELLQYYKLLIEERLQNNLQQKRDDYIKKLIVKPYTYITLIKQRKNMINRKYINPNIDPDILIKEHLKSKLKYAKNSVYHRLVTSIKLSKTNKNKAKNEDDNETDVKSNYDIDTVDEISDVEINLDDYDISDNEEYDDFSETDINDKETGNDLDNNAVDEGEQQDEVVEADEVDEIDECEVINETDYKKMEFLYYKKLLNEQGFVFDENKGCLLVYQEYVQ
jgi:hypothetical protein